jgi:hypothetical protein
MGPGNEDSLIDRARGSFCADYRQRVGYDEQRLQKQPTLVVRSCFDLRR